MKFSPSFPTGMSRNTLLQVTPFFPLQVIGRKMVKWPFAIFNFTDSPFFDIFVAHVDFFKCH